MNDEHSQFGLLERLLEVLVDAAGEPGPEARRQVKILREQVLTTARAYAAAFAHTIRPLHVIVQQGVHVHGLYVVRGPVEHACDKAMELVAGEPDSHHSWDVHGVREDGMAIAPIENYDDSLSPRPPLFSVRRPDPAHLEYKIQ